MCFLLFILRQAQDERWGWLLFAGLVQLKVGNVSRERFVFEVKTLSQWFCSVRP